MQQKRRAEVRRTSQGRIKEESLKEQSQDKLGSRKSKKKDPGDCRVVTDSNSTFLLLGLFLNFIFFDYGQNHFNCILSILLLFLSVFIHDIVIYTQKYHIFAIARIWKQPRCSLTDEWIKKIWYLYTMEYYSAIKRKKISVSCSEVDEPEASYTE